MAIGTSDAVGSRDGSWHRLGAIARGGSPAEGCEGSHHKEHGCGDQDEEPTLDGGVFVAPEVKAQQASERYEGEGGAGDVEAGRQELRLHTQGN